MISLCHGGPRDLAAEHRCAPRGAPLPTVATPVWVRVLTSLSGRRCVAPPLPRTAGPAGASSGWHRGPSPLGCPRRRRASATASAARSPGGCPNSPLGTMSTWVGRVSASHAAAKSATRVKHPPPVLAHRRGQNQPRPQGPRLAREVVAHVGLDVRGPLGGGWVGAEHLEVFLVGGEGAAEGVDRRPECGLEHRVGVGVGRQRGRQTAVDEDQPGEQLRPRHRGQQRHPGAHRVPGEHDAAAVGLGERADVGNVPVQPGGPRQSGARSAAAQVGCEQRPVRGATRGRPRAQAIAEAVMPCSAIAICGPSPKVCTARPALEACAVDPVTGVNPARAAPRWSPPAARSTIRVGWDRRHHLWCGAGRGYSDGVAAGVAAVGDVDQLVADPQAQPGAVRVRSGGRRPTKGSVGPVPVSVTVTVNHPVVPTGAARSAAGRAGWRWLTASLGGKHMPSISERAGGSGVRIRRRLRGQRPATG